jgi:hypothetical protein
MPGIRQESTTWPCDALAAPIHVNTASSEPLDSARSTGTRQSAAPFRVTRTRLNLLAVHSKRAHVKSKARSRTRPPLLAFKPRHKPASQEQL